MQIKRQCLGLVRTNRSVRGIAASGEQKHIPTLDDQEGANVEDDPGDWGWDAFAPAQRIYPIN